MSGSTPAWRSRRVPDSVLLKPGPLDAAETALMRENAALGARIVGDVLDEVHVRWIAAHHERPDGTGHPRGLTASEIPDGAARIALADASDSMVSDLVHSPRRTLEDALAECRALVGRQFTAEAVAPLATLHENGATSPWPRCGSSRRVARSWLVHAVDVDPFRPF